MDFIIAKRTSLRGKNTKVNIKIDNTPIIIDKDKMSFIEEVIFFGCNSIYLVEWCKNNLGCHNNITYINEDIHKALLHLCSSVVNKDISIDSVVSEYPVCATPDTIYEEFKKLKVVLENMDLHSIHVFYHIIFEE